MLERFFHRETSPPSVNTKERKGKCLPPSQLQGESRDSSIIGRERKETEE